MLGLFKSKRLDETSLLAQFFGSAEHRWIWADRTLRHRLTELFTSLPAADQKLLIHDRRLLLLYSDARMSCAFHQYRGREVVIVFPDLLRLLQSAHYPLGQAVLAHEFGHVILGHGQKLISPLAAQFEADAYAASLGFGLELARALADFPHTDEVKSRITRLIS